jgi:hydroxymethylglutaryl-CoA reductase
MDKAQFLQQQLVPAIASISPEFKPLWGKMNLQQMTEHMSREGFKFANGKLSHELVTPEEHVPKMLSFLRSDKEFKENTVNVLMDAEPVPVVHSNMNGALMELQSEIDHFFFVFNNEPDKVIVNPFFGPLDYELWVNLLHKHSKHHLKQFGVEI